MRRNMIRFAFAAALALLACGCDRTTPLSPQPGGKLLMTDSPVVARRADATAGEQCIEGEAGPGALYSLCRPANWNGDLIVWVHGYTPPCAPVALPAIGPLRDALLAQGFGVAYSSFSENGYAVAEAVRQTHQLSGLFKDTLGKPNRTFLIGVSLGGIIGLELIETYCNEYDGALLVSGVLGGTKSEVQYIGDTRVLFDCVFPGALPGGLFDVPPCGTPFPLGTVIGAIQANPPGLGAMLCLNPRLPYANPTEAVTSLVTALQFAWIGAEDLYDRTHRHSLFDNEDVVYSCPQMPPPAVEGINRCVARYSATPDAEAFMRHHYEPDGDLCVRLLTLHNSRDPVVPADHEALYRARVATAGKLDFLCQRSKDSYGHVNFDGPELLGAFAELVAWVTTGQKPPC